MTGGKLSMLIACLCNSREVSNLVSTSLLIVCVYIFFDNIAVSFPLPGQVTDVPHVISNNITFVGVNL